jgi:SAM-dependent methyltransferase
MQPRSCPLCGEAAGQTLLELEADEFCRTNWTYAADYRAILGLPVRAVFPVRRCVRCGFVYAALRPDDTFLAALYDRVISEADCVSGSENKESYARRLRYVAELIELAPPGRALDYGSGLGVTVRVLAACRIPAVGFDPSALRQRYSQAIDEGVTGDLEVVRRRAPYSMIVLDNVLEHLPEPVAVIEALGRLAEPGGIAYVSVPPYEGAFLGRQLDAHRRGAPLDMTLNPWEHLNYFTLVHLDALMSRGGFRRLAASERTAAPAIGLRAQQSRGARVRNALATGVRLALYAAMGDVLATAEHAFYRRDA